MFSDGPVVCAMLYNPTDFSSRVQLVLKIHAERTDGIYTKCRQCTFFFNYDAALYIVLHVSEATWHPRWVDCFAQCSTETWVTVSVGLSNEFGLWRRSDFGAAFATFNSLTSPPQTNSNGLRALPGMPPTRLNVIVEARNLEGRSEQCATVKPLYDDATMVVVVSMWPAF